MYFPGKNGQQQKLANFAIDLKPVFVILMI